MRCEGVMTRHRLFRCQASALFSEVSRRHAGGQTSVAVNGHADAGAVAPWLGRRSSPCSAMRWRVLLPGGGWLDWWLEVEQGANGVLAHLSAVPSPHALRLLKSRLSWFALEAWTSRELIALGRGAESADSPTRGVRGSSRGERRTRFGLR